ncbi:MAG: SAM-dependent chlorinase/fluorinase [Bacteroidota bacterium]
MAIITLTTDLGSRDHYSASLKGTLCQLCPENHLIDITHDVSPFNTLEAAFILKSAFHKFPEGTIHLIGVDPEGGKQQRTLIMRFRGHFFVGPDNGILSLIREGNECECIAVDESDMPTDISGRAFLAQNRLAPAVARLATGTMMEEMGAPHEIREYLWGAPSYTDNSLRGVILHIDHFGNAITNIRKDGFLETKGDRSFQVFIRNLRLQRIVGSYGNVAKGEALAIFSENGHLEIAIREGSAAQLLGLKVQDMLTIEFYE